MIVMRYCQTSISSTNQEVVGEKDRLPQGSSWCLFSGVPETPRTRHTAVLAGLSEKGVSQVCLSANCFGFDDRKTFSRAK